MGIAAVGMALSGAAPMVSEQSPVRITVEPREGTGATVCLQAAEGVRGRKRALVSHGGGSAVLDVSPESPGPHCAELAQPEGTVTVTLQYSRLWVIPSTLSRHTYPAEEARGKRISFLWTRD